MTGPLSSRFALRLLAQLTSATLVLCLTACPSTTEEQLRFIENLDEHTALYRHGNPLTGEPVRYSIHVTTGPGHAAARTKVILPPTRLAGPEAVFRAPSGLYVKVGTGWRLVGAGGALGEVASWSDPVLVSGRAVAREGERLVVLGEGGVLARPASWPDYFSDTQAWHPLEPSLAGAKYLVVAYGEGSPSPTGFAAERPESEEARFYADPFVVLIKGDAHEAACAAQVLLEAPIVLLPHPDPKQETDDHVEMALDSLARRGDEIFKACLNENDPELAARVLAWWQEHLAAKQESIFFVQRGLTRLASRYGAPTMAFYLEEAARRGVKPVTLWLPNEVTTEGVLLWYWRRLAEFERCLREQRRANPVLSGTYGPKQTDANRHMTLAVFMATLSGPYPLHVSRTNPALNVNLSRGRRMTFASRKVGAEQKMIASRLARGLYLVLGAEAYAAALPELLEHCTWTQPEREELMIKSLERLDSDLVNGSNSAQAQTLRQAVWASVLRTREAKDKWERRLAEIAKRSAKVRASAQEFEPEIAKADARYRELRNAGNYQEAAKAAARAASLTQELCQVYSPDRSRYPAGLKRRLIERKLWELECVWEVCQKTSPEVKWLEVECSKSETLYWWIYDDGLMARLKPIRKGLRQKLDQKRAAIAKAEAEEARKRAAAAAARAQASGGGGGSGGGRDPFAEADARIGAQQRQNNYDSARRMQEWHFQSRMKRFDEAARRFRRNY